MAAKRPVRGCFLCDCLLRPSDSRPSRCICRLLQRPPAERMGVRQNRLHRVSLAGRRTAGRTARPERPSKAQFHPLLHACGSAALPGFEGRPPRPPAGKAQRFTRQIVQRPAERRKPEPQPRRVERIVGRGRDGERRPRFRRADNPQAGNDRLAARRAAERMRQRVGERQSEPRQGGPDRRLNRHRRHEMTPLPQRSRSE